MTDRLVFEIQKYFHFKIKLEQILEEALLHRGNISHPAGPILLKIATGGHPETALLARLILDRQKSTIGLENGLKQESDESRDLLKWTEAQISELLEFIVQPDRCTPERGIYLLSEKLHSKNSEILPPLLEFLKNTSHSHFCSYLVKYLPVFFKNIDLSNEIIPFLSHEDDRIVANALEGLSRLENSALYPLFEPFINHKSERVKGSCIKALKRIRPKRAEELLQKMFSTFHPPLVKSGLNVIRHLADPDLLKTLEVLKNQPQWVKEIDQLTEELSPNPKIGDL